ncbi:MAG: response regulator transcription factor [Leptospiraceae bacterium]|nr:response regulator transcription factor [Leptospiraceae bacterium]
MIRIGLVENDERFARTVCELLERQGYQVWHWPSAETYWRDPVGQQLDVLLLDIMLGNMTGIDLAGLVSIRSPDIRKIIITSVDTDEQIFAALRFGCLGYILKSELGDLHATIQLIMDGGAIITPTIAFRVMRSFNKENVAQLPPDERLTQRQEQVLRELIAGRQTPAVAELMGISVNTARNHVKSIYTKLNVRNRQEMMQRARELGFF